MAYCIACGKKGVRWPKHDPIACSMTCLADQTLGHYSAGGGGFYCVDCGKDTDSDHCAFLDREIDAALEAEV